MYFVPSLTLFAPMLFQWLTTAVPGKGKAAWDTLCKHQCWNRARATTVTCACVGAVWRQCLCITNPGTKQQGRTFKADQTVDDVWQSLPVLIYATYYQRQKLCSFSLCITFWSKSFLLLNVLRLAIWKIYNGLNTFMIIFIEWVFRQEVSETHKVDNVLENIISIQII
jgi:hypothetical protein